ncbi:anti-sigma factor [Bradyrhizobium sp. ARR65]|uniref:anti-sigma factor family protein n=1 Tax=Bradyrhizobium sp. ARR65 TaxID=1040989 RepID=UPI0004667C60|nr:anti-sigma factor [Bradyrhizobium sp. ARR65]
MNRRPITEDDLHAYVDQALEPERQAEVASYLGDHPDVAKRVAAFSGQRELLRAALAPIAEEPLPAKLNLARIIENRGRGLSRFSSRLSSHLSSPLPWAVAAMLLLSIGAAGGWAMRGALQVAPGGVIALAQEAMESYNVYAPDHVRPVEMRASDSGELVQWVSSRLHQPVKVPDLAASGYRLMGGRLVATSHGPAAMFMYDDDHGSRIVLLTRTMSSADQNAPMTGHSKGDVAGFAWADGGIGYSLVGQGPMDSLRPLANEVRKQTRAI